MRDLVTYSQSGSIGILTLNSPPVNGLGLPLRRAIKAGYENALADDSVRAIIITSAGKLFCGGADISEFGSPDATAEPHLPMVLDQIEESPKPVIAAINGAALGGGLELALACDYRFAHPKAKLGLPEVHLGILPGGGGTQRLPRLAGAETAVRMITSGVPVSAAQALQAGFVDEVAGGDGDFLAEAIEYVQDLLAIDAPLRSCADIGVDTSKLPENFFAEFRNSIARQTRGYYAPERCIQAVEAAIELPLAEGLKKEQELFLECVQTPQARAQQHLFFAERANTKVPGINPETPARPINCVAVIGSGTMGGGIAMNFINAGIPTILLDLNGEALDRGIGVIRTNYEISAKRGRLSAEQIEQRMGLLKGTTSYDDLKEVDLVIEAVFEDMAIKKQVFTTLDGVCKPGAILATNTSTLDVDEIASATSRPEDVIGLHFFSPANVMKLLEIVRGAKTADDVIVTSLQMAKAIRKVPVVVGVCFGFVGNRMVECYGREGARMVLEGASPAQIDRALTEFGMAMGFCSMADLAGGDVGYLVRESRRDELAHDPAYAAIADKLYELGRYGQKTSRGFYIYEGREQKEDPEVLQLAGELATELGVEQREISDQEIVERMIFSMINEGARILEEGIASRSSDIDLVYLYGYGFPGWRGGPMQYADEIGLAYILAALQSYRERLGEHGKHWFQPAPLLEKLVAENKNFNDFAGRA